MGRVTEHVWIPSGTLGRSAGLFCKLDLLQQSRASAPHSHSVQSSPIPQEKVREENATKSEPLFLAPLDRSQQRLRFSFEKQQAADLSTSAPAWQPGLSLNLSHHLSPDPCSQQHVFYLKWAHVYPMHSVDMSLLYSSSQRKHWPAFW